VFHSKTKNDVASKVLAKNDSTQYHGGFCFD